MDDIEIEYLDEYKDLLMPGIKKGTDGRAATTASSEQASSRIPHRRRPSSDSSGSSSIDADIFQKLFDRKFIDDELLHESGSNANRNSRSRLSSSSSCSDDVIDRLYGQQSNNLKAKRRERLESYDSIDDLGDALMGSNRSLQLPKATTSNLVQRKQHCDSFKSNASAKFKKVEKKPLESKASRPNFFNPKSRPFRLQTGSRAQGSSSSSGSSSFSQTANKKRPVTIVKPPKPDLKPPVHEPKQDPLHLQDFSDECDSDSSFNYDSEFYDDDESDEDNAEPKHVIDISTDTSTITSVADTVTPVVSDDDGQHNQLQQQTPHGRNERLQSYLNNLSSAESPPSKQKRIKRKSHSKENKSLTPTTTATTTTAQKPHEAHEQENKTPVKTLEEANDQLDEPSSSVSKRRLFDEPDNQPSADYVDDNLTYEALERLSLNLEEQIINIDTERSIEFEKRSASKPRSNPSTSKKPDSLIDSSLSTSHVRKLTYSNESLDQLPPIEAQKPPEKSKNVGAKRGRPRKKTKPTIDNSIKQTQIPAIGPTPRKRGRPRKHFPKVIENSDKIETVEKEKSIELKQSTPKKSNQALKEESNIPEINGSNKNITENEKIDEDKRMLVESTIKINQFEMKESNEMDQVKTKEAIGNDPVEKKERTLVVSTNKNEIEPVEKALSQLENSNDSFLSAQEEVSQRLQPSPCQPSGLVEAKEGNLVEQLYVEAGTEQKLLKSEGTGKETKEEMTSCDSAVERDKEINVEKCDEETSVGQCIAVGDKMEPKKESVLKDKTTTESIPIDQPVENKKVVYNLMESSAQAADETTKPTTEESLEENSCDSKTDTPTEVVTDSKEAATNIELPNNDGVLDNNLADEVKSVTDLKAECKNDAAPPTEVKGEKEESSVVNSTNNPCPPTAAIETGHESRSSKRTLRSDVDTLVSNEIQRRNSPRLTDKSPAGERKSPVQLKGNRKNKKEKSSNDSHPKKTAKKEFETKTDHEEAAIKVECSTESKRESSNPNGEENSTRDTQTPEKATETPETDDPENVETTLGEKNSRGTKSKLKNEISSPAPKKTVIKIPKDSPLPEPNKNAQLLGDPTTSKNLINSATENAPPNTDQREAKESILNQDDFSIKLDLTSELLSCKDPLTDSDSEPTITPTKFRSRAMNLQKQLSKKKTVIKTKDLPKTDDEKSEKSGIILEMPKTMPKKEEKEKNRTLKTSKKAGRSREVNELLHDSKQDDDFRSTQMRTQTPNQKQIKKHTKNSGILRNNVKRKRSSERGELEPEMKRESIVLLASESSKQNGTQTFRKCRVRIKRIKLPILPNNSDFINKNCGTEKTLMKDEKETGHTLLTELVKHSVEMKIKNEKVRLDDQELEINIEDKPVEPKASLKSQSKKVTFKATPQLHLDTTEHNAQISISSSLTETTGVATSVDNRNGDTADDFQRDEGFKHREMLKKANKSRQNKMEPPSAPHNKRELPSVEGVLRKMAKRRKILDSSKADSKESASRTPSTAQQNPLKTPMQKQLSPIKSALSCLLSDSEPATVDNSVIITKTSNTTPTIETLKKKEITSTAASGINISVSVVPEPNKQQLPEQETVPVKKTLTQAETVKRLLTINPKGKVDSVAATKAKVSIEQSTLAAGIVKKTKGRKPNVDKRTSLPAKLAIEPSELTEATPTPSSDNPVTSDKIKKGSEKVSVPANSSKPRKSLPQIQTEKPPEISEKASKSKSNKRKSELPKTGKKALLNDSQISEEPTTTRVAAEAEQSVEGSTSESREPSNERTKRTNRTVKSTNTNARPTTPVTRATIPGQNATAAPTSDPVVSVLELPSKPQRLSRKNRKKSSSDLEHSMPSRKRKISGTPTTELTNVKRAKEDATNADVAFPVRITAASTAATVTAVQHLEPAPVALEPVLVDHSKSNELSLPPQPLPLKLRKLRVRINRRTMRIWQEQQQLQRQQAAAVTLPQTSEVVPPLKSPRPPPVVPVVPQRQVQRVLPAAKSVPLPVPLPVFEIKAEEGEIAIEQPVEVPAALPSVPQTEQTIQQRVVDVRATIQPTIYSIAPPAVASNSTSANAATSSSGSSSSGIPLASSTSDSLTFGTTKMFSFLHPSRYQRSYGQVGLDFCCPNLDGPMQAIDPTRLHAKVEVPVLELPQYMVISTKFISKQDKNLPPKVRAKLDQLVAKEGLPCAIQAIQSTLPAPAAVSPPETAVAPLAPIAVPPLVKIGSKPVTSAPILPQKKQVNIAESTETSSKTKTVQGMLQLPTICPTDKLRTELQSRVQLFDVVLQRLARRAATMSASERQMVIENIVKTGSLLPNDVAVGTKLLESYVHHLNVATSMVENASLAAIGTAKPTSTTTQLSSSMLSKPGNATVSRQVQQQRIAGGATGGAVPAATAAAPDRNSKSRPIYDKDKNIIGYQYKAPKMASDTTTAEQQLHGATARSSLPKVGHQQQLQHSRVPMKPATTQAIKMVAGNSVTTPVGAGGVRAATRIESGTSIPASSKLATTAASSSSPSNTRSTSNRNIFIVHQVLSQPEECILPDTVGSTVPPALDAEIKGEIEDTEMLS